MFAVAGYHTVVCDAFILNVFSIFEGHNFHGYLIKQSLFECDKSTTWDFGNRVCMKSLPISGLELQLSG